MENSMDKLIVIVGPTAVGKTALSLELAKKFNGEIVSGDSMQIYRQLPWSLSSPTISNPDTNQPVKYN